MNDMLKMNMFFPSELLSITSVDHDDSSLYIKMRSKTHSFKCPECAQETETYHGTYLRKVQDLPILGKTTRLHITANEYVCKNESCSKVTFVEDFDGFLSYYGRMTERCADFICTLAMETSCEGCSICRAMNLQISGDSVIRLLTKRYRLQSTPKCGSAIGVDDFAFKKRHTYGTIIVDQATHRPVAILDGRDGNNNKHIKTVTRDRASAYSTAIQEILPDAMQIADRFHLHQNLLEAIKNTVNSTIPVDIRIPIEYEKNEITADTEKPCKKMPCNADNFLDYNEKSVQLYNAIHEYSKAGYSKPAISKMLHCSRNKQIQRTAEIKQQRDVQENGNQESKKVDRNIHISEHYSITPIVTKYLHYRFAEGENYVRIGKSTILYSKLFVPIDNVDMTNISGFRNIYFGKARLFHKNEKYRVCFTEKIGSENSVLENYTVMCVIPEEMVENYLFRNGKTEELKEAVNSKKEYDVYLYGKLNKGKKGEILFVNITSLDFLDIR